MLEIWFVECAARSKDRRSVCLTCRNKVRDGGSVGASDHSNALTKSQEYQPNFNV
jgi:hypothetical protein